MRSQAVTDAGLIEKSTTQERLSWNKVELQVTNLERSTHFWTDSLGLINRGIENAGIALGTSRKTLVILHPGATEPARPGHTGLYHVALGVPDQREFSRILNRLIARRIPVSPVDHLMSKALYVSDPDGLGIEIAFETPGRFGRFGEMLDGFTLYDAQGRVHSGRERLDMRTELSHAPRTSLDGPLPDGAFLAHLHLKVNALEPALDWFEGLGFGHNLLLPHLGFADLGAGGAYTHRLALNTWEGQNITSAPARMARLLRYELEINDPSLVMSHKKLRRSAELPNPLDPTGTEVLLVSSA